MLDGDPEAVGLTVFTLEFDLIDLAIGDSENRGDVGNTVEITMDSVVVEFMSLLRRSMPR